MARANSHHCAFTGIHTPKSDSESEARPRHGLYIQTPNITLIFSVFFISRLTLLLVDLSSSPSQILFCQVADVSPHCPVASAKNVQHAQPALMF